MVKFVLSKFDYLSMDDKVYTYGQGSDDIVVDTNDSVTIQNATILDIVGVEAKDGRTMIVFNNLEALNIYGTPASLKVGDYTVDRIYYDNGLYIPPTTNTNSDNSEYTYTYGQGGDDIVVDTNDLVDIENATVFDVLGIEAKNGRTAIVFNNLEALNIYGTPETVMIGETVLPTETYDNGLHIQPTVEYDKAFDNTVKVYKYGDGEQEFVVGTDNWVNFKVDESQIRGMTSDWDRALVVLDDYTPINIFGRPKVYTIGDTIFSTDESGSLFERGQVASGNWQWGTSEADYFNYNYGSGNDVFVVDSNDSVGIQTSSFDQIVGASTTENGVIFMFDNYQTLEIKGKASTYYINDNIYSPNADGSLHYEGTMTSSNTEA